MSYRRLLILYALILILVVAQNVSSGEESHASGAVSPTDVSSPQRPVADSSLSPAIISSLVALFPMFTEGAVKDRYGKTLPKALEDIGKGDESGIATIVAEIFGTLNDNQLASLIDSVKRKIEEEKNKPRERQDPRLIKILERLNEAALSLIEKRIEKEKKKPAAQQNQDLLRNLERLKTTAQASRQKLDNPDLSKFRQAFEQKFSAVKTKNQEFYKNLECALVNDNDDNACKKALIAGGYDPKLLLRFVKEQCATGNDSLCDKMAKGLTFKNAQTGDRFFDVVTPDHQNERVIIGKDGFKNSIADVADQTGGFAGVSIAPKPHERFKEIRPRANRPPPKPTPQPSTRPTITTDPAPVRRREGSSPQPPAPRVTPSPTVTVQPPGPGNNDALRVAEARLKDVEVASCFRCHSKDPAKNPSGRIRGGFELNLDGTPKDPSKVSDMVQRVLVLKDMPPAGALSNEDQQKFREWARLKGVTVP